MDSRFASIDKFVTSLVPSWANVASSTKDQIFSEILTCISPKDRQLSQALVEAIEASHNGTPILITLLGKVAENLREFKDLSSSDRSIIISHLATGNLERDDVAVVAAAYLASLQPDGPTRRLFKVIASGAFNGQNVLEKLFDFVQREIGAAAKAKIEVLLQDESDFGIESLVFAFASVILADGKLTSLADDTLLKEFLDKIDNLPSASRETKRLVAIAKALADGQVEEFALALVKELGVGIDDSILRALVAGNGEEAVKAALESVLKGAGAKAEHAAAISLFLMKVFKGEVSLFAETEQEMLQMTHSAYGVFCRCRAVTFAASQAMKGGANVPTQPAGDLFGIASSALKSDTLLTSIAGNDFKKFALMVRRWTRVEFAEEIKGKSLPPAWPVPVTTGGVQITLLGMFFEVRPEVV